jgi:hypothetical protein
MGNDHPWRRRVRTLNNRSRRFRCCRWRRLWRSGRWCRHRSWRRSLCHGKRYGRCLRVCSRHWDRWERCSRHRWLDNGRRRSGKRRPYGRLRNDNPRRRRHGRSGRRRRSFHRRNGGRCRRSRSGRTERRSSHTHGSLLLANGIQNVARSGNIGEIDLGLNLIAIRATRARRPGSRLRFAGSAQVSAHLLRLMLFHGTGVCLLLSDPYFRKCVENRFAFDFQLPGQIVNSNLAHPPFLSSGLFR